MFTSEILTSKFQLPFEGKFNVRVATCLEANLEEHLACGISMKRA